MNQLDLKGKLWSVSAMLDYISTSCTRSDKKYYIYSMYAWDHGVKGVKGFLQERIQKFCEGFILYWVICEMETYNKSRGNRIY